MSSDKNIPTSDGKEIINPDGSSISELESENHEPKEIEDYHISKDTIPSFKKILVTDDGKDISKHLIMLSLYRILQAQNCTYYIY
ncbi:MAG TPA: hypothetical protein VHJ38_07550 [Nitrososphaeraceae archaeon]|nr:hypothetical protein [Nitrososphaeraceae archaeon]